MNNNMIAKATIVLLLLPIVLSIFLTPSLMTAQAQQQSLTITSVSGQTSTMELKATQNDDGEVIQAQGFSLDSQNVLAVPLNGYVIISGELEFTGAKLTPATTLETVDIPIQQSIISFVGIPAGVYTLDVIVNDEFAYESIIVIGQNLQQVQQIINNQITEVNTNVNTRTVFERGDTEKVLDKEEICRYTPQHPVCAPNEDGECDEGFSMNEDGQCFPTGPCPSGYHRANDDETGACISEDNLEQCPDGSWQYPGDTCMGQIPAVTPTPEPEVNDPCNYYGTDICIGSGDDRQCDSERFDCLSVCEDGITRTTGQCPGDDEDRTIPPTEPEPTEPTPTEPEPTPEPEPEPEPEPTPEEPEEPEEEDNENNENEVVEFP